MDVWLFRALGTSININCQFIYLFPIYAENMDETVLCIVISLKNITHFQPTEEILISADENLSKTNYILSEIINTRCVLPLFNV